jgi:outer membrane protein TolC
VVQGSYTRNTSDNDALTLSINSRTLQPSLSYTNQSQGRTAPQDRIVGTLTIGLSANIAFGVLDALEAAQKQVDAARQALEAARRSSKLQEDLLRSALQTAEQNLANALQARADAERSLTEARERERLGLSSPLASLQAELALAQARLSLEQAEQNRIQRILDLYRFFALPLSEVNQ